MADGGWVELPEEFVDRMGGVREVDGPVPVVLFNGRTVEGPFHCVGLDGLPMLEVYEAETDGRSRGRILGMVGEIECSAGLIELKAAFGPGVWVVKVRSRRGVIVDQEWAITGTIAERMRAAKPREETPTPPPQPAPPAQPTDALFERFQSLLEGQRRQAEAQIAALKEQAERAQQRHEQLQAERQKEQAEQMRALRQKLAEMRAAPPPSPPPPSGPVRPADALGQVREQIEQGEKLKAELSTLTGADQTEEMGLVDQFMAEAGGLVMQGDKLKKMAEMMDAL